jgi:hypothetical protein
VTRQQLDKLEEIRGVLIKYSKHWPYFPLMMTDLGYFDRWRTHPVFANQRASATGLFQRRLSSSVDQKSSNGRCAD